VRKALIRAGIVFLIVLVWALLRSWGPAGLDRMREAGAGLLVDITATADASPVPVTIIEIDDEAINALGGWPLRRDVYARLINRVMEHDPAAVGMAVILAKGGASDAAMNALVKAVTNRPIVFGLAPARGITADRVVDLKPSVLVRNRGLLDGLPSVWGVVGSAPGLMNQAAGAGVVALQASHGGVPRRLPVMMLHDSVPLPSLPLEMVRLKEGVREIRIDRAANGGAEISVGTRVISAGVDRTVWFSTRKSGSIPRLTVPAVLRGEVKGVQLKDRMVLIGVSATGLAQNYANAEGGVLPGADALAL